MAAMTVSHLEGLFLNFVYSFASAGRMAPQYGPEVTHGPEVVHQCIKAMEQQFVMHCTTYTQKCQ